MELSSYHEKIWPFIIINRNRNFGELETLFEWWKPKLLSSLQLCEHYENKESPFHSLIQCLEHDVAWEKYFGKIKMDFISSPAIFSILIHFPNLIWNEIGHRELQQCRQLRTGQAVNVFLVTANFTSLAQRLDKVKKGIKTINNMNDCGRLDIGRR